MGEKGAFVGEQLVCSPNQNTVKRRKGIRLPRAEYADPSRVYFVTVCAVHGTRPFEREDLARETVNCLLQAKSKKGFSLYCYCLMPDHLHLALSPPAHGPDVVEIIRQFKAITTSEAWHRGLHGQVWQRSFYDHIARKEENVYAICEYIVHNPVRAGLAQTLEAYPFCGLVDPI